MHHLDDCGQFDGDSPADLSTSRRVVVQPPGELHVLNALAADGQVRGSVDEHDVSLVLFLALVAAHGWTLGTAGGGLRDRWPDIVGSDAAAHWRLASYDPTTRRLRVNADSPAWAAQLRLHHRRILTALDQLRPGTVQAIDVRVGLAPIRPEQDPDDRPARRDVQPPAAPAQPPLADNIAYQELRRQMREDAAARQAGLDEAAAAREEVQRRHYNKIREPEGAHRPAVEDQQAMAQAACARRNGESHRSRRSGGHAVPLRTKSQPAPARGAA